MQFPAPYYDKQRRTCILVKIEDGDAHYIAFNVVEGVLLYKMPAEDFEAVYNKIPAYSASRAADLYASYAQDVYASPEALEWLCNLTTLDQGTIMAIKGKSKPEAKDRSKDSTTAGTTVAKEKVAKEPKAKVNVDADGNVVKRASAASRFRELIMEGKLTDVEIFATVQKEFDLDDNKRSYVAWYRNKLDKDGMNPPKPVGAETPAPKAEVKAKPASKAKAEEVKPEAKPAAKAKPATKGKSKAGASAAA